jgi:uncharacterized repeat protein (TIGR01451 family)
MISKKVVILACCVLFALSANAKKSPISLITKSFQEVIEVDSSGNKVVKLVDAKKVLPGDVIVYKNSIENNSQKPAKNMVLNNPVPEHMEYVANSAKCSDGCKILYSVDSGNSFAESSKLMVKIGNKKRLALPKEYTNVRWILTTALNPNSMTDVSFKAKLK